MIKSLIEKLKNTTPLHRKGGAFALFVFASMVLPTLQAEGQSGEIRIINLSDPSTGKPQAVSSKAIDVRAAAHSDYDRIVFDLPTGVTHSVEQSKGGMVVSFTGDQSIDLSSVRVRNLSRIDGIKTISSSPLKIQIDHKDGLDTKKMLLGNRLVFDFKGNVDNAVETSSRSDEQVIKITSGKPSPNKPVQAEKQPPKKTNKIVEEKPKTQVERITKAEESSLPSAIQKEAPSYLQNTTQLDDKEEISRQQARQKASKNNRDSNVNKSKILTVGDEISVSSIRPLELAVFARAGKLWVIQPEKRRDVIPVLGKNKKITPERVDDVTGNSEAWVFPMEDGLFPEVESDDFIWKIRVTDDWQPRRSLSVQSEEFETNQGNKKRLMKVDVKQKAKVIEFEDPYLGGALFISPLNDGNKNIAATRRFAKFELLLTGVGVVVNGFTDTIGVQPQGNNLLISDANGLMLSEDSDLTSGRFASNDAGQAIDRLFDLDKWFFESSNSFEDNRLFLENRLSTQEGKERIGDLIAMAKLYFVNGMGHEAIALLRLVEQLQPRFKENPSFFPIKGVAFSLADQHDNALRIFRDRRIADKPEIALWRAYSLGRQGKWKQSYDEFAKTGDLLMHYPEPLRTQLAITLAEVSLNVLDTVNARTLIQFLAEKDDLSKKEQSTMNYLRGKLEMLNGNHERAEQLFEAEAAGPDRYYRAKSAFELLKLRLALNKIKPEDSIDVLERLRYIWRNDDYEIEVMQTLGRFYVDMKDYRKGLRILRDILPLVENDQEKTEEITELLSRSFSELFIKEDADGLPPLTALALYNEFNELTPLGAEGDQAIQKLAERMVEIDLLDRAAKLLEHQVRFRLKGEDAARVGTRLAAIHLLDEAPKMSLEALNETDMEGLPADLVEERQLLKARAFSQLGEPDKAIDILSGMNSEMAHRLNVDVNWRAARWDTAAEAIDPLLGYVLESEEALDDAGNVTALSPDSANLVLNQAVAYTLAGRLGKVRDMYTKFGNAMAKTDSAALFQLIARAPKPGQLADLKTIQSHIGEVDLFKDFLSAYRGNKESL